MKKVFLALLLLVWVLPAAARVDAGQVVGGLLQLISEPQVGSSSAAAQAPEPPGPGEQLALTLRGATDSLLEAYKEEGREYAREVGGIITQRIMEDRKINETLDSMRLFCWAVVIYLTVVTLVVLYMLLRLRVLYTRLTSQLRREP